MESKYTIGYYVLYPDSHSNDQWRLLYRSWYEWDLRREGVDEGFAYGFEKFMAHVARLSIADPGITARNVRDLFRAFSHYTNKEFKRDFWRQRQHESALEGEVACAADEAEPAITREELLPALRELAIEDRELLQTCILFAASYRKGFYKKLAEIYGVSEGAIRAKYREVVSRLREILERQGKLGCPASSGGEPETNV